LGAAVLITLLAYQNCAEFSGSGNTEFSSNIPIEKIPECVELTNRNFNPQAYYNWSNSSRFAAFDQVISSPAVGDLNGDGFSEIVFVSYAGNNYINKTPFNPSNPTQPIVRYNGVLRVIDGLTKTEVLSIGSQDQAPSPAVTPLLIDIDGDGSVEIIYPHFKNNEVIALNNDGRLRWRVQTEFEYDCYSGFSAADINGDGKAEIIKNGEVLFETKNANGTYNVQIQKYKNNGNGCSQFAMNLDSISGNMSIVDSTGVYEYRNGSFTSKFPVQNLTCGFSCFVAAADVDSSFQGKEIIYTGEGLFRIYSSTGQIITNRNIADNNPEDRCESNFFRIGGGSATIGDFDGNPSTTEFAIATGKALTIYDKAGNQIVKRATNDCSSMSTGVTSFDFNGDGKPEILYNDEDYFRVLTMSNDNRSLETLWEIRNSTGTVWEYPIVADLNNDFSPEIIIVANQLYAGTSGQKGLRVFTADPNTDKWMPTRGIWNQHNYFISNVDLLMRATSRTSTSDELARNFRRNLPGKDIKCKN
jgi:hypothetical protein